MKYLLLLTTLSMAVVLGACGGNNGTSADNSTNTDQSDECSSTDHGHDNACGNMPMMHGGMGMMHGAMGNMGEGMHMMNECPAMDSDEELHAGMQTFSEAHAAMMKELEKDEPEMRAMHNHMRMMRQGLDAMEGRMGEHDDEDLKKAFEKMQEGMEELDEGMSKMHDEME